MVSMHRFETVFSNYYLFFTKNWKSVNKSLGSGHKLDTILDYYGIIKAGDSSWGREARELFKI